MKTTSKYLNTKAYNGVNRNSIIFGWTPQTELWNGRWAMIGFIAYILWDLADKSVLRDVIDIMYPI